LLQVRHDPAEKPVLQHISEVSGVIEVPVIHVFGLFPWLSGLTPSLLHV
jgi:hypothetical protein